MKKLPTGAGSADAGLSEIWSGSSAVTRPATPGISTSAKTTASSTLSSTTAGTEKPSLVNASWAGYKKAGPLLISTEHRGTADGKPLHIFISTVSVKLTGSDTWMDAK